MSTELPGRDGAVRARLLNRLSQAGKAGIAVEALEKELTDEISAVELSEALDGLEARGEAAVWNRRWLAVAATDWVTGHVQRLERGDALLRSGLGGEVGYFVPKRSLKNARDGDLVLARPARRGRGNRSRRNRLPEAAVIKVLTPRRQTMVGIVERHHRRKRLVPFDPRLSLEVILEDAGEIEEGTWIVARLNDRSPADARTAIARVEEVLGPISEPGVDVRATLRHLDIPEEFPEEILSAAQSLPSDPSTEDWAGREDLRTLTVVTIDGETARDFDDAISVARRADGGFDLGVHIADVSHYVTESGLLDLEAYRRGTSVYFPDRAVPMLPERLSNGLCSLRPGVPRLTLSVFLEVSPDGKIRRRRFARTVIESKRRLTYSEVRRLLEEPADDDNEAYGDVLKMLRLAERLMRKFFRRRTERGSIDFDLPEGNVILDLDGVAVGVRPGERNVAHRIVEEFMIAANEAAAAELEGHEVPALFRIHEQPDPMRLRELAEILAPLGISLELDSESLHPRALQDVLRRTEGHSSEPFIASLVLRSMKRARYDPECKGHYALSSRHYTHFTSPIRRYPDLLVHRQLKLLADSVTGQSDRTSDLLAERVPTIAEHTSMTEARAEKAERLVLQWKVIRMLEERVGETFEARVTGVQPYGMFLQLSEFFVDGLLPLANLDDDFYEYRGERHELVGRKGRVFRLADEVTVTLVEVDLTRRRLLLGLPPV